MEIPNRNQQEILPYDKLLLLDIDRDKADKLPQEVKRKLFDGELTPLINVSIEAHNGTTITLPLKLQLATNRDGNPALMAYPVKKELSLDKENKLGLTAREFEMLKRGEVLHRSVDVDGEKTKQYLQLDPETKSIIHKRVTDVKIIERLKEMEKINDIELGIQQKQAVREGKPMELNVGGEKVTVGVDLKEPQGFKIINGDLREWERQQKILYDELHPEYLGLVMTDKNRWEYQQVVEHDSGKHTVRLDTDHKKERGMKL